MLKRTAMLSMMAWGVFTGWAQEAHAQLVEVEESSALPGCPVIFLEKRYSPQGVSAGPDESNAVYIAGPCADQHVATAWCASQDENIVMEVSTSAEYNRGYVVISNATPTAGSFRLDVEGSLHLTVRCAPDDGSEAFEVPLHTTFQSYTSPGGVGDPAEPAVPYENNVTCPAGSSIIDIHAQAQLWCQANWL